MIYRVCKVEGICGKENNSVHDGIKKLDRGNSDKELKLLLLSARREVTVKSRIY